MHAGCIIAEMYILWPFIVGKEPKKTNKRNLGEYLGIHEPYQIEAIFKLLGAPTEEDLKQIRSPLIDEELYNIMSTQAKAKLDLKEVFGALSITQMSVRAHIMKSHIYTDIYILIKSQAN